MVCAVVRSFDLSTYESLIDKISLLVEKGYQYFELDSVAALKRFINLMRGYNNLFLIEISRFAYWGSGTLGCNLYNLLICPRTELWYPELRIIMRFMGARCLLLPSPLPFVKNKVSGYLGRVKMFMLCMINPAPTPTNNWDDLSVHEVCLEPHWNSLRPDVSFCMRF